MPRDGSGNYSRAVTPPVNGDVADADDFNDEIDDLGAEITASINRSGTKAFAANQPMGGFKLTGLAAGSANGDSVRYDELTSGLAAKQPLDALLTAIAALTTADDSMLDLTGVDTVAVVNYATVRSNLSVPHLGSANTFTAAQTVSTNATSLPAAVSAGALLRAGAVDGTGAVCELTSFANNGGALVGRRANNTNASKTVIAASNPLVQMIGQGWDGSDFQNGGVFDLIANATWSGSERHSYYRVRACPPGSTTNTEFLRMGDKTSNLEVGKACTAATTRAADWTLAATDESGLTDYHDETSARTFTIPANASVALPIGFVRIIDNTGHSGGAPGAITVAITSDELRRGDGVAGTGSRTIPADGIAVLRKVTATRWVIGGTFT